MATPHPYRYGTKPAPRHLALVTTMSVRRQKLRRWRNTRIGKYIFFAAAAALAIPFPGVLDLGGVSGRHFATTWAIVLLIGSLLSLAGILRHSWVGEYIGLWGVTIPLAILAGIDFFYHPTGARVALGLLVLGFCWSTIARHQDVAQQRKIACRYPGRRP